MQDLFSNNVSKSAPLADRMRPQTLDEFIGQRHIVGEGCLLRRAIKIDALQSSIFWGPPGCGKTTLLRIIDDLLQPTSGRVEIGGETPREARLKRKYGMVSQSAVLYQSLIHI